MSSSMQPNSLRQDIFDHVTTVVHVLIIGLVAFMIWLCFCGQFDSFTWHPLLYSIGWILLMEEATLATSPHNVLFKRFGFDVRLRYHWIGQALAVAFCLAGLAIVVVQKEDKNLPHFKTWHGLLGLITMVALVLTFLNGISLIFDDELRKIISPLINKSMHAIFAVITIVVGTASLILGLYTFWFVNRTKAVSGDLCVTLIVFIVAWCLLQPLINLFGRVKSLLY